MVKYLIKVYRGSIAMDHILKPWRHVRVVLIPKRGREPSLTVLLKVNQVTIMWVPGHSGIQQNETTDRLAREGARTRPIGPECFLPLSLSRFKSKIRNWIEKR